MKYAEKMKGYEAILQEIAGSDEELDDGGCGLEDDEEESEAQSEDDDDESESESDPSARGQVVLLVASRNGLMVHKRISLEKFGSFCPRVAIHPPTYVNKIVIGAIPCH